MHPSTERLLAFFKWEHLPEHLQRVSQPFCELAHALVGSAKLESGEIEPVLLPINPETTVCLRKLLEAKDCAVRAALEG